MSRCRIQASVIGCPGGDAVAEAVRRSVRQLDAVQKIAEERGVSMVEVALAWVTGRPAVTSTILGARTLS